MIERCHLRIILFGNMSKCDAVLAQLVERNLAKVEVTSASLVYRSKMIRT